MCRESLVTAILLSQVREEKKKPRFLSLDSERLRLSSKSSLIYYKWGLPSPANQEMKRLQNSTTATTVSICPNTSGAFIAFCPMFSCPSSLLVSSSIDVSDDDMDQMYTERSDFEAMLDDSIPFPAEKKRRLSPIQVKALEKSFELENKLEPERKVKLAQELGLQPRQVAVWFQNRRARSKAKRLEGDFGSLEANYDGLKLSYERLKHENEALLKEISELKAKLSLADNGEAKTITAAEATDDEKMDDEMLLCDSDSSAILSEDNGNRNSPSAAAVSSSPRQLMDLQTSSLSLSKDIAVSINGGDDNDDYYGHQFLKAEEHHGFFNGDEGSCVDLFSDDQAPSLPWICSGDWD